jgi:cysteine protease ATG4
MWKIPGRMVWSICHCSLHPVRAIDPYYQEPPTHICLDRMLSNECQSPKLRVYVTNNTSDVYEEQVAGLGRDETGQIMPVLILLGLRLGIEHVTSVYWDGLRAALQYPQSVGIAG